MLLGGGGYGQQPGYGAQGGFPGGQPGYGQGGYGGYQGERHFTLIYITNLNSTPKAAATGAVSLRLATLVSKVMASKEEMAIQVVTAAAIDLGKCIPSMIIPIS
jgi:hypothetical protein